MTPEQTTERADALLDLGRPDEAAALLSARLAEAPDDARAWAALARCHNTAGRSADALAATDEALRHQPEYALALLYRATALRGLNRMPDAADALRSAIRLAPHSGYAHAMLGEVQSFRALRGEEGAQELRREAADCAREAVRLSPEDPAMYMSAWKVAATVGDEAAKDGLEKAILRLDPTHAFALGEQTRKAAAVPGARAADTADRVADALATAPQSHTMRDELDSASYRLLRGTRWLALLCLLGAALGLDLVTGERELPLPLGQRLWDVLLLAVVWVLGALLRYRKRRRGVRLTVRSLLGRDGWARLALGQAVAVTAIAVLLLLVPWTSTGIPAAVFWVVLVTTLLTMYLDRPYTRQMFKQARQRRR
ncbi:tetratricopeptide repeat protein [Streptomyces sp. KL116D]|uniref:tetratricopeptide repeat protein n=1 Tax=Streptomyces sp. KL116D TaxID=3045152 RepID=UPI0035561E23